MYYVIGFIVAIIAGVTFEIWDANDTIPIHENNIIRKIVACFIGMFIGFSWPLVFALALIFGIYCLLTSKIVKILTKYRRDYQSFKKYQDERKN